jgi:phospholipid/cholesterol/gamma-HCH transport system substrate-binding protein
MLILNKIHEQMKKNINQNLKLGLLVAAGLAFFIGSVYLLGKKQNLFNPVVRIQSTFTDVKGLKTGNNVRFSGINIGMVSDIGIQNDSTVLVEMSIKKSVVQHIKKDSKVEIENEGLMGNKVLTIFPGSSDMPIVEKGDILSSTNTLATEDILEQAKDIMVDAKTLTENLAAISMKLNNGKGDFSTLLNNNTITNQLAMASERLVNVAGQLEGITQKINTGEGDLAKLINNDNITQQIDAIVLELDSVSNTAKMISNNLLQAAQQVNEGNGVVQKLLYDTTLSNNLDLTMEKVNLSLEEAKNAAETIHNSWVLNVFSGKKKEE